jgi:alkyl hydroperoxide reductase subunit AhpC
MKQSIPQVEEPAVRLLPLEVGGTCSWTQAPNYLHPQNFTFVCVKETERLSRNNGKYK